MKCLSCNKNKIKYFMHFETGICLKCYSKNEHLHFRHNCVFKTQMRYEQNGSYYEVPMQSGRTGLYARERDDRLPYGGTGQHDYKFTFIKYKDEK